MFVAIFIIVCLVVLTVMAGMWCVMWLWELLDKAKKGTR